MWIRKKKITEYWKTHGEDPLTVIVEQFPSGTTNVTAKKSYGAQVFGGAYSSHKGAMVAVGRKFGKVDFVRMVDTLETSKRRFPTWKEAKAQADAVCVQKNGGAL